MRVKRFRLGRRLNICASEVVVLQKDILGLWLRRIVASVKVLLRVDENLRVIRFTAHLSHLVDRMSRNLMGLRKRGTYRAWPQGVVLLCRLLRSQSVPGLIAGHARVGLVVSVAVDLLLCVGKGPIHSVRVELWWREGLFLRLIARSHLSAIF